MHFNENTNIYMYSQIDPQPNPPKVAASFCMLVGACLRCLPLLIPSIESSFTNLCHAGQHFLFTVLSHIFLTRFFHKHDRRSNCHVGSNSNLRRLVSPTGSFFHLFISISLKERTRATSIGQMFNALGVRTKKQKKLHF